MSTKELNLKLKVWRQIIARMNQEYISALATQETHVPIAEGSF